MALLVRRKLKYELVFYQSPNISQIYVKHVDYKNKKSLNLGKGVAII